MSTASSTLDRLQVLGGPVFARGRLDRLGAIRQLWVDPQQLKVVGLEVLGPQSAETVNTPDKTVIPFAPVVWQRGKWLLAPTGLSGTIATDGLSSLVGQALVTEDNLTLGKIKSFEFDVETGAIVRVTVSATGWPLLPAALISAASLPVEALVAGETLAAIAGAEDQLTILKRGILERFGIGQLTADSEPALPEISDEDSEQLATELDRSDSIDAEVEPEGAGLGDTDLPEAEELEETATEARYEDSEEAELTEDETGKAPTIDLDIAANPETVAESETIPDAEAAPEAETIPESESIPETVLDSGAIPDSETIPESDLSPATDPIPTPISEAGASKLAEELVVEPQIDAAAITVDSSQESDDPAELEASDPSVKPANTPPTTTWPDFPRTPTRTRAIPSSKPGRGIKLPTSPGGIPKTGGYFAPKVTGR